MHINFYDKLGVRFSEDNSPPTIFLKNKYRHYLSADAASLGINLLVVNSPDKLMTKELNFINKEAAFDETNFYILDKRGNKLQFNFDGEMAVEKEFDINLFEAIFASIVLTKLFISGLIPLHASGVYYKNLGVVFAGWAGTGKTRILLKFIREGAEFISDEWVFLGENKLFTYFVNFQMANYDIKAFPKSANLSFLEKIRLKFDFFRNFYGFRQIFSRFNLILRSKNFNLSDYFSGIRDGIDLGEVIFLQGYDGAKIKKAPIAQDVLAEKIYQSFARENRLFFHYYNLYKFTNLAKDDYLKNIAFEQEYKSLLSSAIGDRQCYLLSLPLNINYRDMDIREIID